MTATSHIPADHTLRYWDAATADLLAQRQVTGGIGDTSFSGDLTRVAVSRDGRTLATHAHDTIVLYELMTGTCVAILPRQTTGYVAEFAFSPDGKLLASSARDGSIRLLSISSGEVLADFQAHAAGWTAIAFSPDGNRLLSGGAAAVLELRDISVVAKHGHRLDGMRLLYMRVRDGRLNPDDTYRSKWIGGHGGGRETL